MGVVEWHPRRVSGCGWRNHKKLGNLVAFDRRNNSRIEQRFCMALESGGGWITQSVVTNEINKQQHTILVDYCNLSIRCRLCMSTDHLVKECLRVRGNGVEVNSSKEVSSAKNLDFEGSSLKASKDGLVENKSKEAKVGKKVSRSETKLDPRSGDSQISRSRNHYSNGDSRLTPAYEWNNWEKVARHKKQPLRGATRMYAIIKPHKNIQKDKVTETRDVVEGEVIQYEDVTQNGKSLSQQLPSNRKGSACDSHQGAS